MVDNIQLVCINCQTVNRVARARLSGGPLCGKCKQPLLPGRVVELTNTNCAKFISKNGLPVVVNFWASWCGHCRNFEPVFAAAAAELQYKAFLGRVETEEEPELVRRFSVMSMPTHIVFRQGREVARQSGAMQLPRLLQWLEQFIEI